MKKALTFTSLNTDSSKQFLGEGEYSDARNVLVSVPTNGQFGAVQTIKGNSKITETTEVAIPVDVTQKVIGSVEDKENNKIYDAVYASNGRHRIRSYDGSTHSAIVELEGLVDWSESTQVDMAVANNTLFFTDNETEPKKILLNQTYNTVKEEYITDINKPPTQPLIAKPVGFFGEPDFELTKGLYQFIYRYIYNDNSKSVWSPPVNVNTKSLSRWKYNDNDKGKLTRATAPTNEVKGIAINLSPSFKYASGFENVTQTVGVDEGLRDIGNNNIKQIEVAYRTEMTTTYKQIALVDASEVVTNPAEHLSYTVLFQGEESFVVAQNTDQPYDLVPIKAKTLEIQNNRKFYGNIIEDRSLPDLTISVDVPKPTDADAPTGATGDNSLKYWSFYKAGVECVDNYGRKSTVITSSDATIKTDRPISVSGGLTYLKYQPTINISGQVDDWVDTLNVVITENQSVADFKVVRCQDVIYKDSASGIGRSGSDNVYSSSAFANVSTVVFDISNITDNDYASDENYLFTEGDFVRLLSTGGATGTSSQGGTIFGSPVTGNVTLKIQDVDVDNELISCNFTSDIASADTVLSRNALIELYSPKTADTDSFFYETGVTINLDDSAGSGLGTYRQELNNNKTISIPITYGDTWLTKYSTHTIGSQTDTVMWNKHINPDEFENWFKGIGRANTDQRAVESGQRLQNRVRFSNTFVENTKVNGLSTYQSPNQSDMPAELGAITKLQNASDTQSLGAIGSVMLALCDNDSASLYIGRAVLKTDGQGDTIAKTDSVIGTILPYEKDSGCQDMLSVAQYEGQVFWVDRNNGRVCRYGGNGVDFISDVGMRDYFFTKLRDYTGDIVGGFDPYNNLYVLTLNDTIAFNKTTSKWMAFMDFLPEMYVRLNTNFYSYKDGDLYKHNSGNTFYGDSYTSYITGTINSPEIKLPQSIAEHGDQWDTDVISGAQEANMLNTSLYHDFVDEEGVWKSSVLRDKNTPYTDNPALDGDYVRGEVIDFKFKTTEQKILRYAEIYYILSNPNS